MITNRQTAATAVWRTERRRRTDVSLWRTKGQQTQDRKEIHKHTHTLNVETKDIQLRNACSLDCSRRNSSCCSRLVALAHCVIYCMYSVCCPGALNKTMGGTVSNWLYLGFHRATISSQPLIRNSFHSRNGQIISDFYSMSQCLSLQPPTITMLRSLGSSSPTALDIISLSLPEICVCLSNFVPCLKKFGYINPLFFY